MAKRKRKNNKGWQGSDGHANELTSYSLESSDALIRRVDEIKERMLNMKKAGRPSNVFSDGEGEFWNRLPPQAKLYYHNLLFLGTIAVCELKDAFYGNELPDIPVWHVSILCDLGIVDGYFDTESALIGLNTIMHMNYDDPENKLLETVAHELVHYWCHHQGIADVEERCSELTGKEVLFHNAEFKKAAEKHGLRCRFGVEGFSRTELTDEAWARIRKECALTNFLREYAQQRRCKQRSRFRPMHQLG